MTDTLSIITVTLFRSSLSFFIALVSETQPERNYLLRVLDIRRFSIEITTEKIWSDTRAAF